MHLNSILKFFGARPKCPTVFKMNFQIQLNRRSESIQTNNYKM
jgi:hypothetical protein